jgi:hypothetical protein
MNDVDILMQDLRDSLNKLRTSNGSPKDIRKSFSDFINLSQKITSVMRKNFKNGKWDASEFKGWTNITDLFKKLRNFEEHEEIIKSEIIETTNHTMTEPGCEGVTLCIAGTLKNVNPLSDKAPTANVVMYEADPVTGRMTNIPVGGKRSVSHVYNLTIPNTSKNGRSINKLLDEIRNKNPVSLSSNCLEILENYYLFYNDKNN